MPNLLIRNCQVLQVDESKAWVLPAQDILLEGNRIQAIEPTGQLDPGPTGRVLDARGQVAMPGLINTHAHVPMVLFRGAAEDVDAHTWFNDYIWPLESNLEEEDVYWGMLLGLAEMIQAGVTSVVDHYFFRDQAARAVQEAGSRAGLGWAVFGSQGEEGLERAARFVEQWQGQADGRITTWMAPHAPYTCDDDFLRAAAERAKRLGVGIHIHAAETREQTEASLARRGLTPIQVLERTGVLEVPTILAHLCGILPEDIPILARHPVGVAHAPKTYMKLSMGLPPLQEMRAAGIPFGLATDGAASNNTLDIWESMRLMALLQKHETGRPQAMAVHQALWIATRESARVFGRPDDLGHLAPGYLADLILVDLSGPHQQPVHSIPANLVYSTRASDVQTVIVDGRILMRDRQLLTLDLGEILGQIQGSMERLMQRVPERRIQVYRP